MKKEIKLGLFLIIVFVVFAYFIIKTESCSDFMSKGKRYPLIAKFTTSAGMYTSAPVRLAGVKVGIVDEIYLEHRKAVVRMMIENKYKLLDDARVVISTIGFIGEKYVEIVYKDEFKTENPQYILPGGEIKVVEPFNLESITAKFDKIYENTLKITDAINDILSDKDSKESLRASFLNLKSITEKLASLLDENGKVSRGLDHLDHLVLEMDKVFADDKKGLLGDLKSTSEKIDRVAADLTQISDDLRQGKGTAGKLLQDEELYKKIDDSVSSVQAMIKDLEKKKKSLDAITFNYAVHFDYFTRLKKARSGLGMDIATKNFLIMTGVNEDPVNGDPRFTALGGKKIALFAVSAGLVESDLGAALRLNMWNSRLNLDVYAYRFTRERNPLLKTMLRFTLSKNINILAGYYDLLQPQNREFMIGISFGN
jgi:phospholipid/cholesterol/gamma-HCH transport system substrate-binding protein